MNQQIRAIAVVVVSVVTGGLLAFGALHLLRPADKPQVVEPQRDISAIVAAPESAVANEPTNAAPDAAVPAPEPEPVEQPLGADGCARKPPFTGVGTIPPARGYASGFPGYVPERYDPKQQHVVLLLFHDDAQDAAKFMEVSGFVEIAERLSLVIIAPQDGNMMAWTKRDDAVVAKDAMAAAGEALCVDHSRVYAVGYGAGGRIVEELPCIMEVAGIATASYRSTVTDQVCKPSNPVPYIHLAPMKDRYSPPKGGTACGGLHVPISLADKEKMWRERNRCTGSRTQWLEDNGTQCYSWECKQPFASCHVDGGRPWPGTKRRIYDIRKCDGRAATFPFAATIWRFFARGPSD